MSAASRIAVIVAALPFLVAALLYGFGGGDRIFPGIQTAEIHRVEMQAGDKRLILARQGEGWIITSAAAAPGDTGRIEAALRALTRLRGRPATVDQPGAERMTVTLYGATDHILGAAGFRTGEAVPIAPDGTRGPRLMVNRLPALPHWPSAWSSLRPPVIAADSVVSASDITPEGMVPLAPAQRQQLADMLSGLAATGFVAAADHNWSGARTIRAQLRDGAAIDVQLLPADDGAYVRMTSDQRQDVRNVRQYAFRTHSMPLPQN